MSLVCQTKRIPASRLCQETDSPEPACGALRTRAMAASDNTRQPAASAKAAVAPSGVSTMIPPTAGPVIEAA